MKKTIAFLLAMASILSFTVLSVAAESGIDEPAGFFGNIVYMGTGMIGIFIVIGIVIIITSILNAVTGKKKK